MLSRSAVNLLFFSTREPMCESKTIQRVSYSLQDTIWIVFIEHKEVFSIHCNLITATLIVPKCAKETPCCKDWSNLYCTPQNIITFQNSESSWFIRRYNLNNLHLVQLQGLSHTLQLQFGYSSLIMSKCGKETLCCKEHSNLYCTPQNIMFVQHTCKVFPIHCNCNLITAPLIMPK